MTNKEIFIKEMDALIECLGEHVCDQFSPEALEFWQEFKQGKASTGMTETGREILDFMRKNKDRYNNLFNSKSLAEGLGKKARSITGSIRKLVTDGYVSKTPGNPVLYSLVDFSIESSGVNI